MNENQELITMMKEILNITSQMREILEECRNERLPLKLAKKIDKVLKEAKNFD